MGVVSSNEGQYSGTSQDLQSLKWKRQRLSGQLAEGWGLLDVAEHEAAKREGLGLLANNAYVLLQANLERDLSQGESRLSGEVRWMIVGFSGGCLDGRQLSIRTCSWRRMVTRCW